MELLKALIAWFKEFIAVCKKFGAGFDKDFPGMDEGF